MIVIWDLDVVISQLITVTIKVAEPAANHDEVRSIFLIDQGHKAVTHHDQDVENYDHGVDQARGDQLLESLYSDTSSKYSVALEPFLVG